MKKLLFIAAVSLLSFYSCNSKKNHSEFKDILEASLIDTIKPKKNFSVHKEYDENGNLISLDSTYSYIYSNGNVSSKMQTKIFKQFKNELSRSVPNLQSDFFDNFFKNGDINDSIFRNNFYNQDFFFKNKEIEHMLKRMDSITNSVYKQHLKAYKKPV